MCENVKDLGLKRFGFKKGEGDWVSKSLAFTCFHDLSSLTPNIQALHPTHNMNGNTQHATPNTPNAQLPPLCPSKTPKSRRHAGVHMTCQAAESGSSVHGLGGGPGGVLYPDLPSPCGHSILRAYCGHIAGLLRAYCGHSNCFYNYYDN
jgi:hypothetical protein